MRENAPVKSLNLDPPGPCGVHIRVAMQWTACLRSGGLGARRNGALVPTTRRTAIMQLKSIGLVAAGVIALGTVMPAAFADDQKLLNVSYDPTRELYAAVNDAFAAKWKAE